VVGASGLTADDDLVCETGPDGIRLTADRLRKVYVEVTSVCNLACATCIRRAWREPLVHMSVAQFQRLIQGLPRAAAQVASVRHDSAAAASQPITLSLSGFGEPLVHPDFLGLGCQLHACELAPALASGKHGPGSLYAHGAGCGLG